MELKLFTDTHTRRPFAGEVHATQLTQSIMIPPSLAFPFPS